MQLYFNYKPRKMFKKPLPEGNEALGLETNIFKSVFSIAKSCSLPFFNAKQWEEMPHWHSASPVKWVRNKHLMLPSSYFLNANMQIPLQSTHLRVLPVINESAKLMPSSKKIYHYKSFLSCNIRLYVSVYVFKVLGNEYSPIMLTL